MTKSPQGKTFQRARGWCERVGSRFDVVSLPSWCAEPFSSRCIRMAALKPSGWLPVQVRLNDENEWYRGIFRLMAMLWGVFCFVIYIRKEKNI